MHKNDYVLINFEPELGLVVHLDVGIHVADVAVADQVHVTKLYVSNFNRRVGSCLPPRGVMSRVLILQI
jgi:hypothetical protein